MKCKIFYTSFTGNTKLATERIKQGIETSGHACELAEMRDLVGGVTIDDFKDYEVLGFMSPVFGWREPSIWHKFLARLPRLESQPVFIGASAGGNFGNYFYRVEKQLATKGMYCIATIAIVAPSSYIPWNKQESTIDPQELARAAEFGAKLFLEHGEIVIQKKKLPPMIKFKLGGALLGTCAGHDYPLRFVLRKITVDEGKCTKCGICVDNCAWGVITMRPKETFPKFQMGKCGGCCACLALCPKAALSTKSTQGKVRYHEPSYKGIKRSKK